MSPEYSHPRGIQFSSTRPEVLNERLRSELGRNPLGGGLYEWHRADTLMRPVFTGEYEVADGTALIALSRPVYELRPMMPELNRRWALCLWSDAGPESDWRAIFGPRAEWPKRGYYTPTNVVLDSGLEPDLEVTITVAGMIRNDRVKTYADLTSQGESIVERLEKHDETERDGILTEALPAFGNWKPGARCGGVSPPSPEFSRNIDTVKFEREQHVS